MTANVELVIVASLICFHFKGEAYIHTPIEDNYSNAVVSTKNKTKAHLRASSN